MRKKIVSFVFLLVLVSACTALPTPAPEAKPTTALEAVEIEVTVENFCAAYTFWGDLAICNTPANRAVITAPDPFVVVFENAITNSLNMRAEVVYYEQTSRPEIWINEHKCSLDVIPWISEAEKEETHTILCDS